MNIKTITLLLALSTHGSYWCMKRPGIKKENKTTKKVRLPFTMNRVLGNINGQFEKICKQSTINEKIPTDIKAYIKQKFFLKNKEWWYSEKKLCLNNNDSIYGLSFFHNDKLAIGFKSKRITIINHKTKKLLSSFKTEDSVFSLAINNDEQNIAYGLNNGILKIVQLQPNHMELFSLDTHEPVWSLAFDYNNTHLICGLENNTIQLITIKTGCSQLLQKTASPPYGLSFYNNEQFVCGEYKKKLTTLNTKNSSKSLLSKKFTNLFALACNYKNNKLFIGSKDGSLEIINLCTHTTLMNTTLNSPIYSLSFHSNNLQIAMGLKNGSIHFFTHHAYPTTKQLMFRKILYLWLLCKKPDKNITCVEYLLNNITYLFKIQNQKLVNTWNSFPKNMQIAIWNYMYKLIQKHGK